MTILSAASKHEKAEEETQGWADMRNFKRKGYIPRITASRHFIGRASLVISLARSISLQSGTRERRGQLEGLCYASTASSALLHHIGKVGFQEWVAHCGQGTEENIFFRNVLNPIEVSITCSLLLLTKNSLQ